MIENIKDFNFTCNLFWFDVLFKLVPHIPNNTNRKTTNISNLKGLYRKNERGYVKGTVKEK